MDDVPFFDFGTRRLGDIDIMAQRVEGVYFIQAGNSGPVKIGRSDDVRKRLAALQTAHYEKLHLRLVCRINASENAGDFGRTERALHTIFSQHHIRGEWFHARSGLADFIDDPESQTDVLKLLRHLTVLQKSIGAQSIRGQGTLVHTGFVAPGHPTLRMAEDALWELRQHGYDVDVNNKGLVLLEDDGEEWAYRGPWARILRQQRQVSQLLLLEQTQDRLLADAGFRRIDCEGQTHFLFPGSNFETVRQHALHIIGAADPGTEVRPA